MRFPGAHEWSDVWCFLIQILIDSHANLCCSQTSRDQPRRDAMAHRAFARLQTLQNQLAPFDASALEGYLEPQKHVHIYVYITIYIYMYVCICI